MKYKVKSAIRHDGKDYREGDLIPLSTEEAEALLEAGAIEAAGDGKDDDAPDAGGDDPLAEIARAIRSLDRDNPELWTGSGKPRTDAIEAVIGRDISAGERDAAWELIEA